MFFLAIPKMALGSLSNSSKECQNHAIRFIYWKKQRSMTGIESRVWLGWINVWSWSMTLSFFLGGWQWSMIQPWILSFCLVVGTREVLSTCHFFHWVCPVGAHVDDGWDPTLMADKKKHGWLDDICNELDIVKVIACYSHMSLSHSKAIVFQVN